MGAYEGDDRATRARALDEARVLRGHPAAGGGGRDAVEVRERVAGEEAGGRCCERRGRDAVAPEDLLQLAPPRVADVERALLLRPDEALGGAEVLLDLLAGADGGGGLGGAEGLEAGVVAVTVEGLEAAAAPGRLEAAAVATTEGAAAAVGRRLEDALGGDVGLDEGQHRDGADLRGLAVRVVGDAGRHLGEDELTALAVALGPGAEDHRAARLEDEPLAVLGGRGLAGEDVGPVDGDDDLASPIVEALELDEEDLAGLGADALLAVDVEGLEGALALGEDPEGDVRLAHL